MAVYKFQIQGRLPSLNELIDAERTHRQKGANLKKQTEKYVRLFIRQQIQGVRPKAPVMIHYHFYEPNRKRDLDNIAGFAHKIIQDSLVKEGILKNDGWDFIEGFTDEFYIDTRNPRIEVVIVSQETR